MKASVITKEENPMIHFEHSNNLLENRIIKHLMDIHNPSKYELDYKRG